jgi:hypothetical protein
MREISKVHSHNLKKVFGLEGPEVLPDEILETDNNGSNTARCSGTIIESNRVLGFCIHDMPLNALDALGFLGRELLLLGCSERRLVGIAIFAS